MATLKVYNQKGEAIGTKEVDPTLFGELKMQTMFGAVRMYEANRRVGTHSTKTRAEVSGSGRKPFRQKGTGHARQGSFQSPLLKGGGVAHGPKPRDYRYSIPRKEIKVATRSAILSKFLDDQVILVDKFEFENMKPKTKGVENFIATFRHQIEGKYKFEVAKDKEGNPVTKGKKMIKTEVIAPKKSTISAKPLSASFLFVLPEKTPAGKALNLSARNVKWTAASVAKDLYAWNVLRYTMLVLTEESLAQLIETWKEKN